MKKYRINNILEDSSLFINKVKYMESYIYTSSGIECGHFSYRTHKSIKLDRNLLNVFKRIESEIHLSDFVISRFINFMQIGDYIQDFAKDKGFYPCKQLIYTPTGGHIILNKELWELASEEAIVINATDVCSVQKCNTPQLAIIWLIPHWLDLLTLKGVSYAD